MRTLLYLGIILPALAGCVSERQYSLPEFERFVDGLALPGKSIADAEAVLQKQGFVCQKVSESETRCDKSVADLVCRQNQSIRLTVENAVVDSVHIPRIIRADGVQELPSACL
ncbi:MAG: hypothetical protein Q4G42_03855 [Neisseria sp.]|nr:hypothetical protein [Neisseria sp.]